MNTDPNNNKPVEGLQLHPELASPNTNPQKLYQVTVARTDYLYTIVLVDAESEESAESKAEEIAAGQETIWHVADRDCFINGCDEVKGGQSHE